MANIIFEEGKHYRRRGWSPGNFVTKRDGVLLKSWTHYPQLYEPGDYTNYYECDNYGKAITLDAHKFKVGDTIVRKGSSSGKERTIDRVNTTTLRYHFSRGGSSQFKFEHLYEKVPQGTKENQSDNAEKTLPTKTNPEGIEMKPTKVEDAVKVITEALTQEAPKAKTAKPPKYHGALYEDDALCDTMMFSNKKEAKKFMQKRENIGRTLELFKRDCTLSTAIPIIEEKA